MPLTLRFATADDAATLHRFIVELATFEREPDAVEATPVSLAAQLQAAPAPFQCLLAEDDGEAVGFALFFHNYSTWRGRPGLYLEDLFVPERHRGRGVGTALLTRLAAIALARGCARMEWAVLDWNEKAMTFYDALGARANHEWVPYRLTGDALQALADRDPGDG
jgi:GNAT superfamily N-acetyltransferase